MNKYDKFLPARPHRYKPKEFSTDSNEIIIWAMVFLTAAIACQWLHLETMHGMFWYCQYGL